MATAAPAASAASSVEASTLGLPSRSPPIQLPGRRNGGRWLLSSASQRAWRTGSTGSTLAPSTAIAPAISSATTGRTARKGRVCHSSVIWRTSSASVPGSHDPSAHCDRSAPIAASRSIIDLRRTSVGCAVSTGAIRPLPNRSRTASGVTPALPSRSTAPASVASRRTSGGAARSSARFASWENNRKPRTKRRVSPRSRADNLALSAEVAASPPSRCAPTDACRTPSIAS